MLRSFVFCGICVLFLYQVVQAQTSQNAYSSGLHGFDLVSTENFRPKVIASVDREESLFGPGVAIPETEECPCKDGIHFFEHEAEPEGRFFHLAEFNIYPTFSYLNGLSATYNEFEFASHTDFGLIEMENRTVLNVADLPSTISLGPTNFGDDPIKTGVRASGFGDVLSGCFFSRLVEYRNWHLGIGPVFTFPSAVNPILGSSKYTVGPGVHFSAEWEKLTAGFFLWQSWSFAGDSSAKEVNSLFGKPFLIYELNERWHLVYIPLGMSYSWNKAGSKATVPIGGGIRRLFQVGENQVGIQVQAFDYVARKSTDPEWELRFTIEFLFH